LHCSLHTGWIKTRPAQKLLVRVKYIPGFTRTRTELVQNSYHSDSHLCQCVHTLSPLTKILGLGRYQNLPIPPIPIL